ncbi:hypothetical protein [Aeromonas rivipollensis]|uniref:hypothetical protein n=1 Tax=Aeromonas rivipollensis TaxID=948519 RepID=UPI0038D22CA8
MTRYMLVIASVMWSGLSFGAVKYKCDGEWVDYWPCDSKPATNALPAKSQMPTQPEVEVNPGLQSVNTMAPLPANPTNDEKLKALEKDIEQAKIKLAKTKVEAAPVIGGLVHAINSATIATQEQTLAILEQRYIAAKYGLTAQGNALVSTAESTLK